MATRFTVIGEALVDLVEDPRQEQLFTAHAGGSPYNVAVTLGRLGADVWLIARRGPDAFGELLEDKLRASGVKLDRWQVGESPTTLAVASVDAEGHARYGFYLDGTAALQWDTNLAASPLETDVLHLGSLASWRPGSSPSVHQIQQASYDSGSVLVSYDPNVRPAMIGDQSVARVVIEGGIAASHLIKASDEDVGFLYPDTPLADVARRWCDLGAVLVVVTRGSEGAAAYAASGELLDVPGVRINVADTVGAGDSFAGGLLAALGRAGLASPDALREAVAGQDAELAAAVREAVTVSAMTCERPGADPPTWQDLKARLKEYSAEVD